MNKDSLRKVKWVAGIEYYYGDTKLTENQSNMYLWGDEQGLIEEIGEENFKLLESSLIYGYGYFHQWVVKNCGNLQEGLSTELYALVEDTDGRIKLMDYKDIQFEIEEKNLTDMF